MSNIINSTGRFPIISADERLKENSGIKGCIIGKTGIGKTSLLRSLTVDTTLFIDLEAGDLAVQDWEGDTIRARTWQECRDIAVFTCGVNPSIRSNGSYGSDHYERVCKKFGDPGYLDKYDTIFIDSITAAGRLCLQWCKNQPQIISDRTGKEDMRAAYGLHGQEMITWLTHLQHVRGKNIWMTCILDEKLDEFNRKIFGLQIDGSKTANELPGIVDQVITMAEIKDKPGEVRRGFITHTINPYGYPAKDRSGKLECIEEAHLGKLMDKIKKPPKEASKNSNKGSVSSGPIATAFAKTGSDPNLSNYHISINKQTTK